MDDFLLEKNVINKITKFDNDLDKARLRIYQLH